MRVCALAQLSGSVSGQVYGRISDPNQKRTGFMDSNMKAVRAQPMQAGARAIWQWPSPIHPWPDLCGSPRWRPPWRLWSSGGGVGEMVEVVGGGIYIL